MTRKQRAEHKLANLVRLGIRSGGMVHRDNSFVLVDNQTGRGLRERLTGGVERARKHKSSFAPV